MLAAQYSKYGKWDVIKINEVNLLGQGDNQVFVKIKAASINPFDYKVRLGYLKKVMPLKFPATIGGDFAGIVERADSLIKKFKIGDKVFGQAGFYSKGSGAIAEFALVDVEKITLMPKDLDFVRAASLPLVAQSAIQALNEYIKLKKNQKILILGGAGGIGSVAIQIAKADGAFVATTVSKRDINFAKKLGADKVLDYKKDDFTTILGDYDAVFDTVGGDITNKSFSVVKSGGVIVSMAGKPDMKLARKYEVAAIYQNTNGESKKLKKVVQYVEGGKLIAQVDKVFKLEEVSSAFKYQETQHPRGKVVIKINGGNLKLRVKK